MTQKMCYNHLNNLSHITYLSSYNVLLFTCSHDAHKFEYCLTSIKLYSILVLSKRLILGVGIKLNYCLHIIFENLLPFHFTYIIHTQRIITFIVLKYCKR
jgi:hypothetical protein